MTQYHIPLHLTGYLKNETRLVNDVKSEFNTSFREAGLKFDIFYNSLRKIDKAVFLKVGHFLHYYAKPTGNVEFQHKNNQLCFLACIAAIESCFGEHPQGSKAGVIEFFKENVPPKHKKILLENFNTYNLRNKQIIDENIMWERVIDIRNNFMHRSILISLADTVDFASTSNYSKRGKYTGGNLFSVSTDAITEAVKAAIIEYFGKKTNQRIPKQNYRIR